MCRLWELTALHADWDKKKSFFFIVDKLLVNVGLKWIFLNRNIKEHYNATPTIGISFNNYEHYINARLERPCCNKQFNCFVVDLKSRSDIPISEKSDSLFRINFPIQDLPDVTILTFINLRVASKFGFYSMKIWIAVVDEITICRYNFGNHYCKIGTEFLFMFINNPSYKAYVKYLFWHFNTPYKIRTQLNKFRQEIGLVSNSTAFMHVSYGRKEKFYCLDTSLFREVFPEVRLLSFYGKTSYMGKCFHHIPFLSMYPFTKKLVKHTTILLISRQ
ncbi:hypothetical protein M0802_016313 [Mischocyttarus mexicanus]|nr:hypothetical protein M0802_016313 [Mischocyttarus mexicanus]